MEANQGTLPLNTCHVHKLLTLTNRLHMLLHSTALGLLFYYRACFLFQDPETRQSHHLLPWLLVFASEIILSFVWIVGRAFRWRPVSRTVFPERLPEDDKLPALDVFICTADPIKEPTLEVMNTVLSAMALDYPPEKLHVYLSDDGGSSMTLRGMREAWKFARWWLPFCTRYRIKSRCPKAYFSTVEEDDCDFARSSVYAADKKKIKEKYEAFKEEIIKFREDTSSSRDIPNIDVRDHPSVIEVMQNNISNDEENVKMPLLVYVSREKRPSHPPHFKAGALNVLLRVSAMMSNSPYILVLDCDMFCNDPSSARYAMCFHLDPKMSSSLAFVQFPQKFHNVSKNDIYDSQLRSLFTLQWRGMNGLKGPVMSGTGFYIKRVSLRGNCSIKGIDLLQLKQYFGSSNEFIKSLTQNYTTDSVCGRHALLEVSHSMASCNYEIGTKWGEEVGFLYYSVVEDYLTGFVLHCKGWTSVFCEPSRPQFLGTATTSLNEVLIQGTRWYCGLFENGINRFCPLISGMPLLQSLCYAELTYFPLYCLPLWCFATIPQLCLLIGIPLYPKVSDPFFIIFLFIFLSSLLNHLQEVFITGGTLLQWINEQRIWMMKSITCHLYGCLDALMKQVGIRQASFLPTNKAEDDEQTLLYEMDKYDFRASNFFIVPMLVILTINISCFAGGVYGVLSVGDGDKMFIQLLLAGFIITVNYPIIEGLVVRKDKGRISQLVAIRVISATVILLAIFYYANKL